MAKKTKIRTSKKLTKSKYRFRPWMAVVVILVVIIAGLVIVRFSQASGNRGVMYAGMPNMQVCTNNYGQVQSLYICRGSLVDTADGQAWRTSVNEIGPALRLSLR